MSATCEVQITLILTPAEAEAVLAFLKSMPAPPSVDDGMPVGQKRRGRPTAIEIVADDVPAAEPPKPPKPAAKPAASPSKLRSELVPRLQEACKTEDGKRAATALFKQFNSTKLSTLPDDRLVEFAAAFAKTFGGEDSDSLFD